MTLTHQLGLKAMKLLSPERAHGIALTALGYGLGPTCKTTYPSLQTNLCGLDLPSPVGLAAGFDKDAAVPDAMLRAGFGFVEMGSVYAASAIG